VEFVGSTSLGREGGSLQPLQGEVQWCHSVTEVVQWWDGDVTMVLSYCSSGVTVVSQMCCSAVRVVLQCCHRPVARGAPRSCRGIGDVTW
jgi:hypothetical protein